MRPQRSLTPHRSALFNLTPVLKLRSSGREPAPISLDYVSHQRGSLGGQAITPRSCLSFTPARGCSAPTRSNQAHARFYDIIWTLTGHRRNCKKALSHDRSKKPGLPALLIIPQSHVPQRLCAFVMYTRYESCPGDLTFGFMQNDFLKESYSLFQSFLAGHKTILMFDG